MKKMAVTLEREVEAGTERGGEDLVLFLNASFTGTKDELKAFLADKKRLRKAVVRSFDNYRGKNGNEVEVCETKEEVAEHKKFCDDFCFYKEGEDEEEQFWVKKTDYYDIQFDDVPANELFDDITEYLQDRERWSCSFESDKWWSFEDEFWRTGNAE